jgi:Fe-S-cluster-containing dehydrogenase component/formate-dependent nitrite reductase membrane component NrfD
MQEHPRMNYGFLIDQRSCIGCHACTVACKSENEVPLGVFRTWVKYIEKGEFPNSRRHFLVERCNHCANAPCVEICPTQALFKRPDGIVDFDKSRCIGCKACMEACPYDAIYIDPMTHTAAKCNFCAHRIDQGMQPACVVVCPEEAIIFGDLDDPSTRISQLIGRNSVQVRRPEQGTEPKLFYIGADEIALMPEALPHATGAMWNEPTPEMMRGDVQPAEAWMAHTSHAQVDYNIRHERPWGWMVSAYLLTKSLAAGFFLVLALLLTFGVMDAGKLALPAVVAAVVFLGLTTVLLVADLEHPERFLYIIFKPHWSSWLVLGAWALMGYTGLLVIWLGLHLFAAAPLPFTWLVALFAALTAVYTAFLFGQAEGRDLWQGPLLPVSLLAQAMIAGAAGLAVWGAATSAPALLLRAVGLTLVVALLVHGALIALELLMPHPTANAAWGVRALMRGEQAQRFWGVGVGLGVVAALVLLIAAFALPAVFGLLVALAGIVAFAGMVGYEHAFVQAGQAAPLS